MCFYTVLESIQLSSADGISIEDIQELRVKLIVASENGLFARIGNQRSSEKISIILNLLKEAEESLCSNSTESNYKFDLATSNFDDCLESAGMIWRLKYFYGIPILLYLIAAFIALILTWFYVDINFQGNLIIFWVPVWAIIWGGLGSVLRGLWWLWFQVNRMNYRKVWLVWFLATPFIGCLLGSIMYLVFLSGFIAATQSSLTNNALPMLLSALAGFSWPWAIDVLNKLTKIFGAKTPT